MLKINRRRISPEQRRTRELMQEYEELCGKLEQIRTCFDLAEDEALIDALIYEENAVQCRMAAVYKKAKSKTKSETGDSVQLTVDS